MLSWFRPGANLVCSDPRPVNNNSFISHLGDRSRGVCWYRWTRSTSGTWSLFHCRYAVVAPGSQSGNELQTFWVTTLETVRFHPERSVFTAAGVGDHRGDQWYQCESLSVNTPPRLCSSHCGEPLFGFRSLKWSVIILLKVVVTLMSAGLYYCTVKVLLISQTSAGTTTCRHSEASFIKGSFF